jgi:hypothetical protein
MLMIFRLAEVQTVKKFLQANDLGSRFGGPLDLRDRILEIACHIGGAIQLDGGDLQSLRRLLHGIPVRSKTKKSKTHSHHFSI